MKPGSSMTLPGGEPFLADRRQSQPFQLPELVGVSARFDANQFDAGLFQTLDIDYPDNIARSVPKRQAEFLAGRHCAAECLRALDMRERQVGIGEHRSPQWPSGIVGSIAHTDENSIAVASRDPLLGVGVDLQTIEAKALRDTQALFVQAADRPAVQGCALDDVQVLALVFSVKESYFKMAYAYAQCYFDFDAVSVRHIDPTAGTVLLRVEQALHAKLPVGMAMTGHFAFIGNDVLTLLAPRIDEMSPGL